jgi:hypothetical protein
MKVRFRRRRTIQTNDRHFVCGSIVTLCLLYAFTSEPKSSTSQAPFSRSAVSKGTLIVTVPVKEGLVICTDKREYNVVRGATDNQMKIRELGPRAAFAEVALHGFCDVKIQRLSSISPRLQRHTLRLKI